jgi:polyhydroxybutyrate depolymerase
MRKIPRSLASLLLLAGCVSSAPPTTTPSPAAVTPAPTPTATLASGAIQSREITVGGQERTYLVAEPALDGGPVPLLVALHPFSARPEEFVALSQLADLAETDGVLVAFPAGISQSWNAGTCCGDVVGRGVDDVGFIRSLIETLASDYPVDPDQVFVAGFSNGGMLAYRVGCELSDVITAIGVVGGALVSDCQPAESVSLIVLHGAEDNVVPLNGGEGFAGIGYPSVQETVEGWAAAEGCEAEPMSSDSQASTRLAWSECASGGQVLLITATEQGHLWFFPEPDASAEIWDFFDGLAP